MTAILIDHLAALLAESTRAWGLAADIRRASDATIFVIADGKEVRIARSTEVPPFRWMVSVGKRTRGATGIAGVLRSVRTALDPDFHPIRLRIAALPRVTP